MAHALNETLRRGAQRLKIAPVHAHVLAHRPNLWSPWRSYVSFRARHHTMHRLFRAFKGHTAGNAMHPPPTLYWLIAAYGAIIFLFFCLLICMVVNQGPYLWQHDNRQRRGLRYGNARARAHTHTHSLTPMCTHTHVRSPMERIKFTPSCSPLVCVLTCVCAHICRQCVRDCFSATPAPYLHHGAATYTHIRHSSSVVCSGPDAWLCADSR